MSTLELENIKHPDNSGDNIALASNGNVGIGTGSPSDRLHLQKSNDTGIIIENTTGATLSLLSTGAGRVRSSGTLIFDTGGATERMRVGSNGYVGVGTSTPLRKLHIADAGDTHIVLQSTNAVDDSEIFEIGAGANSANKVDLTFRTRLNSGSGGAEHMRITNDGYVTTPNQPSFMAHGNAGWQLSAAGANITFGGVAFNNSGSYNSSNSRFTAPVAGKYMFITTIYQDNTYDCRFCMTVNGVQLSSFGDVVPYGYTRGPTTSGETTLSIQYIANLNLNDYVEVRQRASYGSARVYTSHSHFGGHLIG